MWTAVFISLSVAKDAGKKHGCITQNAPSFSFMCHAKMTD